MRLAAVAVILLILAGGLKWVSAMAVKAHEGERRAKAAQLQYRALQEAQTLGADAQARHKEFAAGAEARIQQARADAARYEAEANDAVLREEQMRIAMEDSSEQCWKSRFCRPGCDVKW